MKPVLHSKLNEKTNKKHPNKNIGKHRKNLLTDLNKLLTNLLPLNISYRHS